jgi:hypothetical protein
MVLRKTVFLLGLAPGGSALGAWPRRADVRIAMPNGGIVCD